ncbi:type II toxin-antitoxin system VapC family toxin [Nocardioides sp. L-11A]|uniref:type II toxin-antitoxin system VapC family toxin n=1 Tax=Nocardioides sp. L-11A TaxID=3043848 RepID=UPI00249AD22B|nr:type II toxin-antitoxin system VapC family toxin [Nocardioides sp. L-11A]
MTAVLDASALAEIVANTPRAVAIDEWLVGHAGDLHLPHLAVVETASVLRGWARSDQITAARAAAALEDLAAFPARRWAVDDLLPRIWSLRDNLTAYDATYLALTESLDATLITCDARLRRGASGHSDADIVVP